MSEPANYRRTPDSVWQAHIGHLKKWVEQKPESITARVALADTYTEYAWQARGRGFANTVKEEGWALFEKRLALAESVLNDAKKLNAKCPQWYMAMQIIDYFEHYKAWAYDRREP